MNMVGIIKFHYMIVVEPKDKKGSYNEFIYVYR